MQPKRLAVFASLEPARVAHTTRPSAEYVPLRCLLDRLPESPAVPAPAAAHLSAGKLLPLAHKDCAASSPRCPRTLLPPRRSRSSICGCVRESVPQCCVLEYG